MSRTRNRILSAALLLPVVLFSVVWTSFALWRCQYDGVARRECCSPSQRENAQKAEAPAGATEAGNSGASVSGARCCDLEQHQVDKAPADTARGSGSQAAAILAISIAEIPVAVLPALDPLFVSNIALPPPGLGPQPVERSLSRSSLS